MGRLRTLARKCCDAATELRSRELKTDCSTERSREAQLKLRPALYRRRTRHRRGCRSFPELRESTAVFYIPWAVPRVRRPQPCYQPRQSSKSIEDLSALRDALARNWWRQGAQRALIGLPNQSRRCSFYGQDRYRSACVANADRLRFGMELRLQARLRRLPLAGFSRPHGRGIARSHPNQRGAHARRRVVTDAWCGRR